MAMCPSPDGSGAAPLGMGTPLIVLAGAQLAVNENVFFGVDASA